MSVVRLVKCPVWFLPTSLSALQPPSIPRRPGRQGVAPAEELGPIPRDRPCVRPTTNKVNPLFQFQKIPRISPTLGSTLTHCSRNDMIVCHTFTLAIRFSLPLVTVFVMSPWYALTSAGMEVSQSHLTAPSLCHSSVCNYAGFTWAKTDSHLSAHMSCCSSVSWEYLPPDAPGFKSRLDSAAGIPVLEKGGQTKAFSHVIFRLLRVTVMWMNSRWIVCASPGPRRQISRIFLFLNYLIGSNQKHPLIFWQCIICVCKFEWNESCCCCLFLLFARDRDAAPNGRTKWGDCLWHKW